MTTPNQTAGQAFGTSPDLLSLVGLGAFQVGNADQNFGQNVTEAFVKSLIQGPAVGLPTSISDVAGALSHLGDYLKTLPLEALQLFQGLIPGSVIDDFNTVENAVETIVNAILIDPLGSIRTVITQIIDIFSGAVVTPINDGVQQVKDWFSSLGSQFSDLFNQLWSGLHLTPGTGKSSADVGNAAAGTAGQAQSAVQMGELNSAVLAVRNNKSLMSGIDETEESNFLLTDLFSGGSDPTDIISATASSVPVAFWRAEQTSKKGFISWFGKGFANVTALYIDVYRANYATSTWDLIHTSPNVIGLADTGWKYMVYNISDVEDRIDIEPGDVLGVAWRVEGTGTHSIAGKSAGSWLPDHPTVVPSRPASTRTGSGAQAFSATTYSSDIPWFGIGIITGDIVPPVLSPRPQTFTTPTFTYTIPEQFRVYGSIIDVVLLGDGGAGNPIPAAPGGAAGTWLGQTLVYGVDIPLGTTELTGTIGQGGLSAGVGCTVVVPGGPTITTAGGAYSGASGFFGESPGTFQYNGIPYAGGGEATVPGQDGFAPGGGGGSWATWGASGKGARGQVWFNARQA